MSNLLILPGQPAPKKPKGPDETSVNARGILAALDPLEQAALTRAVGEAVKLSYRVDRIRAGSRPIVDTTDETKRRARLTLKIFGELTFDLGWGLFKAMKFLPQGLRAALDQTDWSPKERVTQKRQPKTAKNQKGWTSDPNQRSFYRPKTLDELIVPG